MLQDNKNQMLYPCKNCIKEVMPVPVPVEEFDLSKFFDNEEPTKWLRDIGCQSDAEYMPSGYVPNHSEIHQKIKEKCNYRCERCGIDLNAPDLKRYADCHHVNADKMDNRMGNLQCLCVKCHAEQFRHSHMKQDARYKKFLPIWQDIAVNSGE